MTKHESYLFLGGRDVAGKEGGGGPHSNFKRRKNLDAGKRKTVDAL